MTSVFSEICKDISAINSPIATTSIKNNNTDHNGVLNLLKKLDPVKATGPDKVSSRFLKEFAEELTPAMTLFFKSSLVFEITDYVNHIS